jgi:Peroxisomal biogenesis factor 11 (PEX11)
MTNIPPQTGGDLSRELSLDRGDSRLDAKDVEKSDEREPPQPAQKASRWYLPYGKPVTYVVLDTVLEMLSKTEGRDKFSKFFQYGSLFLGSLTNLVGEQKAGEKFTELFREFKDARKLMRLFKWSIEYKRIMYVLEKRPPDATDVDMFLIIAIRLLLMVYWVFDNLDCLAMLRILKVKKGINERRGKWFWLASLGLHLIVNLRILNNANQRLEYLKRHLDLLKQEGSAKAAIREQLDVQSQRRIFAIAGILKVGGDILVSSRDTGILKAIVGKQTGVGLAVGAGGVLSAAISLWGMYNYTTPVLEGYHKPLFLGDSHSPEYR